MGRDGVWVCHAQGTGAGLLRRNIRSKRILKPSQIKGQTSRIGHQMTHAQRVRRRVTRELFHGDESNFPHRENFSVQHADGEQVRHPMIHHPLPEDRKDDEN